MSMDKKDSKSLPTFDDDELERLAAEEILKEAKRGKDRSERIGVIGWKKLPGANKVYLKNMMTNAVRSNKRKELPKLASAKDCVKKSRLNEKSVTTTDKRSKSRDHAQNKAKEHYHTSHSNKVRRHSDISNKAANYNH
ncbi:uncharacterized protein TRIADDRAFT_60102 [Trichoplax adhaerens]|uniref:Uncharacterized protein n=1 Tax=Trichoplax adhaerens TaxID=10228 RepID=B3S7B1_TRIAD|nr:predicted protein [Trichoplax adhaerens]EDV21535.1 predicted protein [Trichoplax adhaerens]|eukprot:XP_002116135.1 predicted protein [Trichoplax adhaerens]